MTILMATAFLIAGILTGTGATLLPLARTATLPAAVLLVFGIALGAVSFILFGKARRKSHLSEQAGLESVGQTSALVDDLFQLALGTESAARKLAGQVGETLASIAKITSRTTTARRRTSRLSDQVADGAAAIEEILASVESLARQTEQQRSVVEQSAAAIEEMSASIDSVASVSSARKEHAERLRQATDRGSRAVTTTERMIEDVSGSVTAVHAMIDVINDIAARTNLLAMNAAIEAAHAGTSGRGFAVVAAEIRKLAENTAQNASGISTRLTELVGHISEAKSAGSEADAVFREITTGVDEVVAAFAEISAGTAELSAGSREIVIATESLRDTSLTISGSTGEMRYAAEDINRLISKTRETANETLESMDVVAAACRNVTGVTNRVTALSSENNEQVLKLIDRIRKEEDRIDIREAGEARERLLISRIILSHLSWVGTLRAYIDQDGKKSSAAITNREGSELGQWLTVEGKTIVTDPPVFRELTQAHQKSFELAGEIKRALSAVGNETTITVEDHFSEILNLSLRIVEILTTYQSGSFIRWSKDYSVEVEIFDQHHKKLFDLIGNLYKAMKNGITGDELIGVTDTLLEYSNFHFSREEEAMERFGYAGCANQKKQHAHLVKSIKELRDDIKAGKAFVAVEVMEFLRDWLTKHIRGCDKLYAEFFRNKDLSFLVNQE